MKDEQCPYCGGKLTESILLYGYYKCVECGKMFYRDMLDSEE